ncbi:MAG: hypothetical protein ACO3M2_11925 [Pseudohongiellaceae bacterium]
MREKLDSQIAKDLDSLIHDMNFAENTRQEFLTAAKFLLEAFQEAEKSAIEVLRLLHLDEYENKNFKIVLTGNEIQITEKEGEKCVLH